MTSGTQAQTQQELAELYRRREARQAEQEIAEKSVAECERRLTYLSSVQIRATQELNAAIANHDALKIELTDAWIAGTLEDQADAARQFGASEDQVSFRTASLKRTTEDVIPRARVAVLQNRLTLASIIADLAVIATRAHTAEVVLAAGPAAALEGSLVIKGQRTEQLSKMENQAQVDLEQARLALEREVKVQNEIKTRTTGPVSYTNF